SDGQAKAREGRIDAARHALEALAFRVARPQLDGLRHVLATAAEARDDEVRAERAEAQVPAPRALRERLRLQGAVEGARPELPRAEAAPARELPVPRSVDHGAPFGERVRVGSARRRRELAILALGTQRGAGERA